MPGRGDDYFWRDIKFIRQGNCFVGHTDAKVSPPTYSYFLSWLVGDDGGVDVVGGGVDNGHSGSGDIVMIVVARVGVAVGNAFSQEPKSGGSIIFVDRVLTKENLS